MFSIAAVASLTVQKVVTRMILTALRHAWN